MEALFAYVGGSNVKKENAEVKVEQKVKEEDAPNSLQDIPTEAEAATNLSKAISETAVKKEDDAPVPAVVFKKRKKIAK